MLKRLTLFLLVTIVLGILVVPNTLAQEQPDPPVDPPDVSQWVEDKGARQGNLKKFIDPDSPWRRALRISSGRIHYRDEHGQWANPVMVPEDIGDALVTTKVDLPVRIPKQADGIFTVSFDGRDFSFRVQNVARVQAVLDTVPVGPFDEVGRVKFNAAFTDVNLTYRTENERLRKIITLTGPGHPRNFVFDIVESDLELQEVDGEIGLFNDDGVRLGTIERPFVAAVGEEVRYGSVKLTGNGSKIVMELPDLTGLEYPIEVDPTISKRIQYYVDDGYANPEWNEVKNHDIRLNWGKGLGGETYQPYVRWSSLPSELDSVHIAQAWVRFISDNTQSNRDVRFRVYAAAESDNDPIDTIDEWREEEEEGVPRTSVYAYWEISDWNQGWFYDSPDIKEPLKEAKDDPGWNRTFLILFDDVGSSQGATRSAYSADWGAGRPELWLIYEDPLNRGIVNDGWADVVYGQPNFNDITIGHVDWGYTWDPSGMAYDDTQRGSENKRYLYYTDNNHRILVGWLNYTVDPDGGDTVSYNVTHEIGVVNGVYGCNGDSSFVHKEFPAPSNKTICNQRPQVPSVSEAAHGTNPVVRPDDGALIFPDIYNNRILVFLQPWVNSDAGKEADFIIGQADFVSGINLFNQGCNRGAEDKLPDQNSLCFHPLLNTEGDAYSLYETGDPIVPAGVDVDDVGNLWVADTHNHRVLRFPRVGNGYAANADIVLGQPNFQSNENYGCDDAGSSFDARRICFPSDVEYHNGSLYIAVHGGHQFSIAPSDGRLLVFDSWYNGKTQADGIWDGLDIVTWPNDVTSRWWDSSPWPDENTTENEDGLYRPTGLDPDPSTGNIWVTDAGNHQILLFDPVNHTAMKVIGKDRPRFDAGVGCNNLGCDVSTSSNKYNPNNELTWEYNDVQEWHVNLKDPMPSAIALHDGAVLASGRGDAWQNVYYYPSGIPDAVEGWGWNATARLFNRFDCCFRNENEARSFMAVSWDTMDILPLGYGNSTPLLYINDFFTVKEFSLTDGDVNYKDPSRVWLNESAGLRKLSSGELDPVALGSSQMKALDMDLAGSQPVLWMRRGTQLEAYSLPLGDQPQQVGNALSVGQELPIVGDSQHTYTINNPQAIYAHDTSQGGGWLLISEHPVRDNQIDLYVDQARPVYRVLDPAGTNPRVDMIIGKPPWEIVSANDNPCKEEVDPQRDTVCSVMSIEADHYGNIYLADRRTEQNALNRVTEFNVGKFASTYNPVQLHIDADRVYLTNASFEDICDFGCGPTAIGFDENNYLYIGRIPWGRTARGEMGLVPTLVYYAPLSRESTSWQSPSLEPNELLYDVNSFIAGIADDGEGDLYLLDANRTRILRYFAPFAHQGRETASAVCPSNTEYTQIAVYNPTSATVDMQYTKTFVLESTGDWQQWFYTTSIGPGETKYLTDYSSDRDFIDYNIMSRDVDYQDLSVWLVDNYCY